MAESPQVEPESAPPRTKVPETDPVEPGEDSADLEEVAYLSEAPGPQFSQEEHRAKATKLLALLLFWALIVLFIAHFGSVVLLAHNKSNSVEEVTRVFNTWIPVFSGLFGSAATFYFTQGRSKPRAEKANLPMGRGECCGLAMGVIFAYRNIAEF